MNKTFFGQNIYRISSSDTTYNIDVTVNYPWTLSGESVEFRLMQSGTVKSAEPGTDPDGRCLRGNY